MKDGRTKAQKTSEETSRPRGRPPISSEQRDDMRLRIAEAAKKLFETEGYGKVSMRRIAENVGVSPMTLYKYYDAKIDVLRTLWADIFARVFHGLDELDLSGLGTAEQLLALSEAYLEYWLQNTEQYRLVFMAEGVTQSDVDLFVGNPEIVARFQVFIEALCETEPPVTLTSETKLKLDTLICCLHGIAHNQITISGYAWSEARAMLNIVISGIMKK